MVARAIALGPEFDTFQDDSEETLVGSSLHQGAITALFNGLTYCGPRRGLPWFIGNQLTLIIPRRGHRPPAQPSPDILVHPTLTAGWRASLDVAAEGPPVLVIEVVSPATAPERDLNVGSPAGRPHLYAASGIGEYLAFDPTGEFLPRQIRAWRATPRGFEPWPDAGGRWVSEALGVAFTAQGVLLRVYDQDGRLAPIYEEAIVALAERDREIAELQAELRRLRRE